MIHSDMQPSTQAIQERRLFFLMLGLVVVETFLVTLALVPAQLWTRLLPQSPNAALDGPFPPLIAPVITLLIYLTPTVVGFLCKRWQQALLYATLPVWIGLGLFVVAATGKVGAFYLVSPDHVVANASALELFAALGGIGWLARYLFKSL
jgi:hypothetical protein